MKSILVIRHVPEEALGKLELVLGSLNVPLQVVHCFADNWPAIERAGFQPARHAGLIVMGGPMHANDVARFPFLATEIDWLRRATTAELPTLGICLGAQLLAKSLGSNVYANRVKEIGWHGIELLPMSLDDPLFRGAPSGQIVFQWHGDTFDLPRGATLLARGAACHHQAFRHGINAYGLQFHPEMTPEMVDDWLVEPNMCAEVSATPHVDPDEIRRRAPAELARSAPFAEQIFSRFAELCRQYDKQSQQRA